MRIYRMRGALLMSIALLAAVAAAPVQAQEETQFPQEIVAPEATIVVYQPQPEKLAGNVLTGRAAIALKVKGKAEPIFGALWFTSVIDTDAETRMVLIRDIHVTKVRWPDSKAEDEQRFTQYVDAAAARSGLTISTDRLSASLESAERERKSLADLKNDPPKLVFTIEAAVLLLYDGEPRWGDVENSPYERALNTPYLVVRDKGSKTCYLSSGQLWYSSKDPLSGWQPLKSPPAGLVQLLPKDDSGEPAPAKPPAVVVATEPTELVATDGEPKWKSVAEGRLLYVENTETPWLREVESGQMYVLLSGRWFRAGSAAGPWSFVRSDQLPEAFKAIPAASEIAGVRVSVAGTEEAEDALLDNEIPQTAAIKRGEATFDAEYQGEPLFEAIPGTSVKVAVNSASQILQVGDKYYAVDNGVWFVSPSPKGPWAVADSVPEEEIQKIPPSSSAYNVTHVHVYQSTPEVVYVGYTPGYRWAFPYYGVPVYGTGWYYPPHPRYYYPRPYTFGLHVGYNPWTGWNFGTSWTAGFLNVGVSWGGGWGAWGHRPGCCGGWYGGYRPGWHGRPPRPPGPRPSINIGNNINYGNRERVARNIRNNPNFDRARLSRDNIYNRPENRPRNADRAMAHRNLQQARPRRGDYNNVLADRDGNVVRKSGANWQAREGGKWQNFDRDQPRPKPPQVDRTAARPTPKIDREAARPKPQVDRGQPQKRAPQIDRGGVQRDWQNRQRARQRETVQRQMPKPKPQQRVAPPSRPAPKQGMPSRPTGGGKFKR